MSLLRLYCQWWGLVYALGRSLLNCLSRKARYFQAKRQAMEMAVLRLGNGSDELQITLAHLRHNELFLEKEHPEWLRLLLNAEGFI